MTCKEFRDFVSISRDLSPAAREHLAVCNGCRAMQQALARSGNESVDPLLVRDLQGLLAESATPVRTLPSNRTLVALLFAFFIVFALLMTIPFGYYGFRALTVVQRLADYGAIAALAVLFSLVVIRELIPGSKRFLPASTLLLLSLAVLTALTIALFGSFDATRFRRGTGCLRTGLLSAIICGAAASLILRLGYVTAPVRTGALLGGLAGLAGFAVLALHCPILFTSHILIWHAGAAVIATVSGTLIGYLFGETSVLALRRR